MVLVILLLKSVKVFFGAIKWAISYLSDNSASSRLSSAEAKYCCYFAALLSLWTPAWVLFKLCSSINSLYYNAKNIFNLAYILSALGFLRHSLHTSV